MFAQKVKEESNWIICILSLGYFIFGFLFSMQPPLFPPEAASKGLTPSQYSLPFMSGELVGLIFTLVTGFLIQDIGAKYCMCIALLMTGLSTSLFGLLTFVDNASYFLILACVIRILQSTGMCVFYSSGCTTLLTFYPRTKMMKTSIVNTAFYMGSILGPIGGELLNALAGFSLPFVCSGPVFIIVAVLVYTIIPDLWTKESSDKCITVMDSLYALKIGSLWAGFLAVLNATFSEYFLAATLETHIRYLNLPLTLKSLIFIINPSFVCISNSVVGNIIQKGTKPKIVIASGMLLGGFGFMFLGPIGIFMEPVLWMVIVALIFNGISTSACFAPGFIDPILQLKVRGFPSNEVINGFIQGLCMAAGKFGGSFGSVLGGTFFQYFGMPIAVILPVCVCFGNALITFILYLNDRKYEKDSEKTPLLGVV